MSAFIHINGLDFSVFIRGLLVVATGVGILMGSVYLLLATNSGARTGLLLAATAFFGWMTIMGFIWWVYGIGLKGDQAAWKVIELNRGDLTSAQLSKAATLGNGLTQLEGDPKSASITLTGIFKQAEESQDPPEVAGWTGMLASNRARGEAQATVDAFLTTTSKEYATGSYIPVAAFEVGGKENRPSEACKPRILNAHWGGCWDRAWHRVKIAFEPHHPTHYAVIMVQAATPQSLTVRPGEAPPLKELDTNQPIETVIMERDLGSRRLPPAVITFGCIIIFTVLATRLHDRDRREMAARAAHEASAGKR